MTKKANKTKFINILIAIVLLLIGGYFGKDLITDNQGYEELPLEEYYEDAEGLTGVELAEFLRELVTKDFQGVDYADAKVALAEADVDPNDDTKVLTIYSRDSVNREWDSTSWHREHVWPNSRLGVERVKENDTNIASDLHNLRAIVPRVNSSRSNKFYDNVTDENSYYPGDEDKGDVARILFYMVIRYPQLQLVNDELDDDPETNYKPAGAKMAKLDVLLEWHYEDPVDDFERNRNEVIYRWQKNRNPFIDHPEFVQMIFEDEDNPLTFTIYLFLRIKRIDYGIKNGTRNILCR